MADVKVAKAKAKSSKKRVKDKLPLSRDDKRKSYWLKQLKSGKSKDIDASGEKEKEESVSSNEESVTQDKTAERKRYILFIGNLPFSATSDDILAHFERKGLLVTAVRMLTKKGTDESKGCCFIELQNAKHQQIAVKFHHTKFKGRRINIEVTCGGGGAGEKRKEKIKQRNEKVLERLKKQK